MVSIYFLVGHRVKERIMAEVKLGGLYKVSITEAIEAYNAGYDYNEQYGDKKNWD
jgi:hypothetical protein